MRTCAAALLLAATGLLAVPAAAAPASAAGTCQGRAVTIVAGPGEARSVGTPGPDVVLVTGSGIEVDTGAGNDLVCATGSLLLDVDLGPGRDRLVLADPGDTAPTGSAQGGDDGDALLLSSTVSLSVDLQQDRVRWYGTSDRAEAVLTVDGFRDVRVDAPGSSVVGDRRDNRVVVAGCGSSLARGERGDDVLRLAAGRLDCLVAAPRTVLSGGPGDDRLTGGPGRDLLRGGTGTDVADGAAAVDTCVSVERRRSCERNPEPTQR